MQSHINKSSEPDNFDHVRLLDCTLRDGGYYNNWDFEPDVVERYLQAVQAASIDVVEIGFRSLPKSSFMGPYVYCTDEFSRVMKHG